MESTKCLCSEREISFVRFGLNLAHKDVQNTKSPPEMIKLCNISPPSLKLIRELMILRCSILLQSA